MDVLISSARKEYHRQLLESGVLAVDSKGIPSNADSSSRLSVQIADGIARRLMAELREKSTGQTAGAKFEQINMEFLHKTFLRLSNLRPGTWHVAKLGNRSNVHTNSFYQYEHLAYLSALTKADPNLAACLGNNYIVAPDIVIYRDPEPDETINNKIIIVDDSVSNLTAIRLKNNTHPILHASISAKWTMRSDRAQNSRTEALGLIRNRKGHLPHIAVVTGEPLPGRLASLALGTGDIDCMYHFALYELIESVKDSGAEDSIELLDVLIEGKRLKDISDLPLDLAL